MPERVDDRLLIKGVRRRWFFLPRDGVAKRWPDHGNREIARPTNQPQENSLAQRESSRFYDGRRFSIYDSGRRTHADIVAGLKRFGSRYLLKRLPKTTHAFS